MSHTTAVQRDTLNKVNMTDEGRPLCPACKGGRLHPYLVEIAVAHPGDNLYGAECLTGWVAVCQGDRDLDAGDGFEAMPPCGFTMPMTPHRRPAGSNS